METALAECIGERDATEQKLREAEFKENQVRRDLEAQVSALKQEAAAHNAVSQSVQDELRKSASEQAEELRQAVERMAHLNQACAEAESKAKAAEEARLVAVDGARDADASLERIEHSLQLVQEEKDDLRTNLANVTSAFEACQEDLHRCRETKTLAQSGHQQASERLVALEKLVEDTQGQNSRLGGDLDLSIQRVAELTTSIEAFQGEANAASARIIELEAAVTAKQEALRESAESLADAETLVSRQGVSLRETGDKVAELEARLHASQGQLHTTQEELHGEVTYIFGVVTLLALARWMPCTVEWRKRSVRVLHGIRTVTFRLDSLLWSRLCDGNFRHALSIVVLLQRVKLLLAHVLQNKKHPCGRRGRRSRSWRDNCMLLRSNCRVRYSTCST